jgi:type I restriction enzyme S subunit
MSAGRYPSYRSSGAGWLGEVPSHWDVHAGRRLFALKRDPALETDEQLSATQKHGVIPQSLFMKMEDQKVTLAISGTDNFKHVEPDDFVISLRSFQGGIEHSKYRGCVSPAYTVLRPILEQEPRYWSYLLRTNEYIAALNSITHGIRDGKNISFDQFGSLALPQPPLCEQVDIALFLDRETAKIDALIEEQQRLIELLKEKRQAVISHAVTKGLDPSAPMKDSGVEWLGQVPAHWEVAPLKVIASCNDDTIDENTPPDFEMAYIDISSVSEESGIESVAEISFSEAPSRARRKVQHGDIILSTVRTYLRAIAPIKNPPENLIVSTGFAVVRPKNCDSDWLGYAMKTHGFISRVIANSVGVSYPAINASDVMRFNVPVPTVKEQKAITAYLNERLNQLASLSFEAKAAIALLQERRAALISAAVTGKIDVRGLVAENAEAAQ